jgi:squalene-hopene/tetraprenyl-beta-curcumene cyclase
MNRINTIANDLLANRNKQGFWDGELSSSALGVAVSVIAFYFYDEEKLQDEIKNGIHWLIINQNRDGGLGDSPESLSNISTSLLCYSALHITRKHFPNSYQTIGSLAVYLKTAGIDVNSQHIAKHILDFYQKDYTFSVPILTTCALCGIPENDPFRPIPQLPFELALMPRNFYRLLNLNVVSYAIPALVAVGMAIFKHKQSGWLMKAIRKRSIPKAMMLLEKIMPQSGGFLEAIPLTAFVSLSLIQSGYRNHKVVEKGIGFLKRTQRTDGSWPIDIDLSNWVTTLAVKSLRGKTDEYFDDESKTKITNHLLAIQNKTVHPFNGSPSGGWGWTHYSGSVPDGDDTPGAILALLNLNPKPSMHVFQSVIAGCDWLLKLQNNDGGFPTFSRGWGKLPFDQSCADLTGHAVVAIATTVEKWGKDIEPVTCNKYQSSIRKAIRYLKKEQKADGTWLPLWFGNQQHYAQNNPVYGTARVTAYLTDTMNSTSISAKVMVQLKEMTSNAQTYLIRAQNSNGSWGGDTGIHGNIEETALAVSALAENPEAKSTCERGLQWLEQQETPLKAAPIGLYFASLWYSEKLYPQVMYLEAMVRVKYPNE